MLATNGFVGRERRDDLAPALHTERRIDQSGVDDCRIGSGLDRPSGDDHGTGPSVEGAPDRRVDPNS